jgi:O-antigen/teichoic acid export membrane protein
MKAAVISGAILVGLFFCALAALYWVTPANHLPAFVPGYDAELEKPHHTHAVGMLIIGVTAFVLAWFRSWGD